ncbi:MAG TPA: hypothetical protein VFC19_21030 [Candidatus Limnocylindrales bacterium]|nr:hypothetical protein [Candidatus Limnocylindrales bacterium]
MKRLRCGQVWQLADEQGPLGAVLVLSGNAYNELPGPTVLIVRLLDAEQADPASITVRLGDDHAAVLDWVTYAHKGLFGELLYEVEEQKLSDVRNMLFRLLATS